eukprot:jgi/Tetstr1/440476/TSEL_028802.t1
MAPGWQGSVPGAEYPEELSSEAVSARLELLEAEEGRPAGDEKAVTLWTRRHRQAVELRVLSAGGAGHPHAQSPFRSRTGSSGLVPSLASAFDWLDARRRSSSLGGLEHLPPGTALARFRTALPGGPTDPGAAGRQLAGALLAGWAPCLWAGGGKVLESCTLETLGPGARVLYQLLRGPGGGLADACFVSAHRHAASGGELVGQWSVEHPACPPPQRGVRRCTGLVAFLIHPESGASPQPLSGVCQMAGGRTQADAVLAYVEALAAFAASGLGRAQHAYLAGGRLPAAELLGDLTIGAWRWASDLGLWAKGRSKAAKVWRAGRPGTLARAIRFKGTIANTHAGTLAQALFNPEFQRQLPLGAGHSVERVRVLEAAGNHAKIVHVEEVMGGERRDYCVLTCLASLSSDSWVVAQWSVDHVMALTGDGAPRAPAAGSQAPPTKRATRLHVKRVFLVSSKGKADTSLVVASGRLVAGAGAAAAAEAELEELPAAFSAAMSGLLHSGPGEALLGASGLGLRGAAMHAPRPGLLGALPPCMLDCLDACLRPPQLRIRPILYS